MEMDFTMGKEEIRLVGIGQSEPRLVGTQIVNKALKNGNGKGILLQIYLVNEREWTENEMEEWEHWVRKYPSMFGELRGLPLRRSQDHKISLLPGSGPVNVKPYRYPHYQKQEIEKMVDEMLSQGIIQVSHSPYSSPVLLVKKSDGTWRICIDYRGLNKITVRDRFPILVIEELLDELKGA